LVALEFIFLLGIAWLFGLVGRLDWGLVLKILICGEKGIKMLPHFVYGTYGGEWLKLVGGRDGVEKAIPPHLY
jgi:hypothetical protein